MYFLLLDYLVLYKNPSVPDLYSITGTLSIQIVSSKGFNPYITVADDASPLYLLTLLKYRTLHISDAVQVKYSAEPYSRLSNRRIISIDIPRKNRRTNTDVQVNEAITFASRLIILLFARRSGNL